MADSNALFIVKVIRAKGLKNLDNVMGTGLDKSDPFVKLSSDVGSAKGRVIDNSLDPVWNESLVLCVNDVQADINVEVWDHDVISKNDKLGSSSFKLHADGPLPAEKPRTFELSLGSKCGSIELEVKWIPRSPEKVVRMWIEARENADADGAACFVTDNVVLETSQGPPISGKQNMTADGGPFTKAAPKPVTMIKELAFVGDQTSASREFAGEDDGLNFTMRQTLTLSEDNGVPKISNATETMTWVDIHGR